jgi:hypothetical protein
MRQYLVGDFRVSLCHALAGIAAMTTAGEPHATVSPHDRGLNFVAFDRVVHVPALEPGPAALAEGILQESV